MHMQDEWLVLVDEEDRAIGKMPRSEVYAKGLNNFRAVNAFLKNSKGELWIPRRTANKRIFPLCLDMSMGGHVEAGEDYDQTFEREMREELNIEVSSVAWRVLGELRGARDGVSAFMRVYEVEAETSPNYNKEDFVESFWLKPGELLARLDKGEKAKGDLAKLVRRFYPPELAGA